MESGGQPVTQAGLGLRKVDTGDADLGESQPMRPSAQLNDKLLLAEVRLPGHLPILGTRALHWPDEAACAACAQALAAVLMAASVQRDAFIALHGPLGAGKTTFVRHLLRALGVSGRIKSPTYALLESYERPQAALPPPPEGIEESGKATFPQEQPALTISHLDFYRFEDPREWVDAGLRDVFAAPGLKLAEWPEHAAAVLPAADLSLFIEPAPDGARQVRLEANTALGMKMLP